MIRNREYKQRIADFSGLKFGNIYPTDIDGFIDFGGKLFVFFEMKYSNAQMSRGQEWGLERLCDACHNPPKSYSVAFISKYESTGDINCSETIIIKYRWMGKWHHANKEITLAEGIKTVKEKVKA